MRQLDRQEQTTLNDLRFHWDEAYRIMWDGNAEEFTAERLGKPAKTLTDTTLAGLREQIRLDYAEWAPRTKAPDRMST